MTTADWGNSTWKTLSRKAGSQDCLATAVVRVLSCNAAVAVTLSVKNYVISASQLRLCLCSKRRPSFSHSLDFYSFVLFTLFLSFYCPLFLYRRFYVVTALDSPSLTFTYPNPYKPLPPLAVHFLTRALTPKIRIIYHRSSYGFSILLFSSSKCCWRRTSFYFVKTVFIKWPAKM